MFIIPIASPFTAPVTTSDSSAPGALIDGPQMGLIDGARTAPDEQEAVYDIMRATGNEWAIKIPDVCRGRWHGIECMPDRDNVYHVVSLSFGELSGDTAFPACDPTRSFISPSIAQLPHIRTLFFYRCFGYNPRPIPAFLGRLGSSLQTLVLRENGHVGPIPNQLGNLTRLTVLDLHNNNLNGSIPPSLTRITGLRSLDLSGNRLTGPIPGLSSPVLSVLDLNQNLLTGSIPARIGGCDSLVKLDLSRNRLSGPIPESIGGLKDLILMDLSYNRLAGPIPMSVGSLNSLQALVLKGNPTVSASLPSSLFDDMKALTMLVLSDMNLWGHIPESMGKLPNIRVIHLDRNRLNGSIPESFGDLKGLSELRLNHNRLTGSVPFPREVVWRMRKKLRLGNNLGLCFKAGKGFGGDGWDSLVESGIGYCGVAGSEQPEMRTVKHVSNGGGGGG